MKVLAMAIEIGFIDYRSRFHISRLFYSLWFNMMQYDLNERIHKMFYFIIPLSLSCRFIFFSAD